MRKVRRFSRGLLTAILVLVSASVPVLAQDAVRGFVVPVAITGDALVTDRGKVAEPDSSSAFAGFRAVFYPGVRINRNWFVSSTVEVQSEPFFYYEAFYPEKKVEAHLQQFLLGYSWTGENSSVRLKLGRLTSAFGSFPLRYSDTVNPLLDQPFAYAYPVKLRPDQLPCGVHDLAEQANYSDDVEHYCGGATVERGGMVPVTLYGIPGGEVDLGWRRIDSRFQITNSSPVNPQSLRSGSQHLQWTAGGGFTIRQGFRAGVSGFRGPFLEKDVSPYLNPGTSINDFSASGVGTDVQWGRGRWSANAEWNRVKFNYPRFRVSPAIANSYVELKTILTPRFYTALRAGYQDYSAVEDSGGNTSSHFLANRQSYELAVGYHLTHLQTLKLGYEWLKTNGQSGTRDNVFGIQFVTSVNSLSKAF